MRNDSRLAVSLALALALLGPATPEAEAKKKDCSGEQQHLKKMVNHKSDAAKAKNEAEGALRKAEGAVDAAKKYANTYDQKLAEARSKVAARTRDVDECRKRRKDNDCSRQEDRQKYAQEELAKLEANPPARVLQEAQAKLERAREQVALETERLEAAKRAVKEAEERLAKCQKANA